MVMIKKLRWEEKLYFSSSAFAHKTFQFPQETLFAHKTIAFDCKTFAPL